MEPEKSTQQQQADYDACIRKVNQLTEHLKILSTQHLLQGVEEIVVSQDYLNLLANSLYAINSLAYSYSTIKNIPLPPDFSKVQELYKMAKNPLAGLTSKPSVVVNKEAATRIIKHSLN